MPGKTIEDLRKQNEKLKLDLFRAVRLLEGCYYSLVLTGTPEMCATVNKFIEEHK